MMYEAPFLLAFSILLIPLSPFLAIMERLLIALGAIGMVFALGIIILSSPLIFLGGVVLILAGTATTSTGIYFIAFSIISPLILAPLLSAVNDPDVSETPGLLFITNILVVLAFYTFVGSSSPLFLPVVIACVALVIGDAMNDRMLDGY